MRRMSAAALALLMGLAATPANAVLTDTGQQNLEIQRDDTSIVAWATDVVDVVRGPVNHVHPEWGDARVLRWYPAGGGHPQRLRVMPYRQGTATIVDVSDVDIVE